jgi:hypothetical protein
VLQKQNKIMKFLSDYMNENQSALFAKTGSFFAFGQKQFDEKKKEGVVYVNMGGGLICPKENAKQLNDGLNDIFVQVLKMMLLKME